jgi:hypothetical protein
LNISAFFIASPAIYGSNWTDPSTGKQPFSDYSNTTFLYNDITYSLDYMLRNGTCEPLGTYQWGFSFLLLFIFLITLLIWSVGTYILWLRAYLNLRACDVSDIPGEYKAVMDLAAAMQHQFEKEGLDLANLTEDEITRKIVRDWKGGSINHDKPLIQRSEFRLRAILARVFKKEKWWLLAYLVSTALWAGLLTMPNPSPADSFFFIFGLTVSIGVFLAMFIGNKTKSRVLLIAIPAVFGIAFGAACAGSLSGSDGGN